MKRKNYKDFNNSKYSKFQKKRNYKNDQEASTSTNINFQNNDLEKSNTEFITGVRARSIQLLSSYNIDSETSNPFSDHHNLPSFQESNFFIPFCFVLFFFCYEYQKKNLLTLFFSIYIFFIKI